jgi:hypothetical protein
MVRVACHYIIQKVSIENKYAIVTYDDLNFSTAGCSKLIKSFDPVQLLQKFGLPLSKEAHKHKQKINDSD